MEKIEELIEEIREVDRKIARLYGERRKLENRKKYLEARSQTSGHTNASAASNGKLRSLDLAQRILADASVPLRTTQLVAEIKRRDSKLKENTLRSHLLRLRKEGALHYNLNTKEWCFDPTRKE
jgi:hypothetical protein